jgi:hypothetical protein
MDSPKRRKPPAPADARGQGDTTSLHDESLLAEAEDTDRGPVFDELYHRTLASDRRRSTSRK